MTRYAVVAVTASVMLLAMLAISATVAEEKEKASDDFAAQIKTLEKERVETLSRLVTLYTSMYRSGMVGCEAVYDAQRDLVNAQLDASETREERIALLEAHVKTTTAFFEYSEGRYKAGATPQADAYRARALLLDAKIRLLRERGAQER